ncbi:hypothetical protein, partial [Ruminococcus sp.]|uniref:hypothetical protein n=1 Tax=Ruminococcus sp. TaxID=41978 RepID=UPI0025F885DC
TTTTTTTSSATSAKPADTTTTTKTTIDPDAKTIVLDDVKIGETYDLTPYQDTDISAVSFIFSCKPQYGMNGCAAFGNWEMSQNYTADDLTGTALTVSLDKFYNSMVLYKWYGDTELESVVLHCGDTTEETTVTTTTTTSATTTTTQPTTTTTTSTTTTTTQPTTTTTTSTTTTTTQPTTTTTTSTTTTTTQPTTTTTTSTTTQPTTTTTTSTTTTTTQLTTTTTTSTTTATAPPTTTQTTPPSEDNTIILTDVTLGESYSLTDYDYQSIDKIVIELEGEVGYGFGGALILGNWTVQNSYGHADLQADNTITFDVTNPQDRFTLFRYWGTMELKSVTLYLK